MSERESAKFRATSGAVEAFGETPLKALAALMRQGHGEPEAPIVIWTYNQGDTFFTETQQRRLEELKGRRGSLTPEERAEPRAAQ